MGTEGSREGPRIEPVVPDRVQELVALGDETGLSVWSEASYRDLLAQSGSLILRMAAETDLMVGFIAGRIVPGNDGPVADIYNIAVRPPLQGRGFARQLLAAFMTECASRGVRNIWLEVRRSNSRAIGFYEKNGFRTVNVRPGYYADPGEDALIMCLDRQAQTA